MNVEEHNLRNCYCKVQRTEFRVLFLVQTKILEDLKKEYSRRPGHPSELTGSDALKCASYKEAKILKYYEVKNR